MSRSSPEIPASIKFLGILWGAFVVSMLGCIVWVAFHFISKYW